jgi:hypothetical protein
MKIGKLSLVLLAQPRDVEEQLVGLTGCSRAELTGLLAGPVLASTVAAALLPFVSEPPALADLARAITESGLDEARLQVLALVQGGDVPAPKPKGAGGGRRQR